MKIYTRTGDNGTSALFAGKRASKSGDVFEVLGTIDELNSFLGSASLTKNNKIKRELFLIQNELFDIGALIAKTDLKNYKSAAEIKSIMDKRTENLEKLIDSYSEKLPPLKNFILPGGSEPASQIHISRAVCRRLERKLVVAKLTVYVPYFNRLSDLLFTLARYSNKSLNKKDVIWNQKI